jgi:CubicO group peptidase (beta-lactamase class C family)
MDRSGFFELDRVNENLAVGYSKHWSASGVEIVNNIFAHVVRGGPAGGGYSTVGDLLRFAEALRNGELTSKSMFKILTTAKVELSAPMYGYGFTIHPERALYGHEGRFTGISANLDMVEDPPGWTVIVLANDNGMRAPALKARQLIGVTVPETATRAALSSAHPRAR